MIKKRLSVKKDKVPNWFRLKIPEFGNKKVLDIGCSCDPKKIKKYYSLDINPKTNPTFVADITKNTGIKSESFDVVSCISVLEHVKNPFAAIREINRILKKGGIAFITVPFFYPEHEKVDCFRFTSQGIKTILEENGFKVIKMEKRYPGVLSTITSLFRPATYILPLILQRLSQIIITLFLKCFQFLDYGRNHFYSGTTVTAKKEKKI